MSRPSELRLGRLDQALAVALAGDVGRERLAFAAIGADRGDRFLDPLHRAPAGDHAGALASEHLDRGAAHAGAAAGDQRDLAAQSVPWAREYSRATDMIARRARRRQLIRSRTHADLRVSRLPLHAEGRRRRTSRRAAVRPDRRSDARRAPRAVAAPLRAVHAAGAARRRTTSTRRRRSSTPSGSRRASSRATPSRRSIRT